MTRVYKKQIVQELIEMPNIDTAPLLKLIERKTSSSNKIIRFSINRKKATYLCTNCNQYYEDKKVNLHKKLKCPHCGRVLEVIGSHNRVEDLLDYVTVFETNERNELICRLFHFQKTFSKEFFNYKTYCFEVVRMNVDRNTAVKKDTYWVMCNGWRHSLGSRDWRLDRTTYHYYGSYRFSEDVYYDFVFCKNLKKQLSKTKYKYSAMDLIARHGNIDVIDYLRLWEKYPKVELLAKAGCFNLIKGLLKSNAGIGMEDIQICMKNKVVFKYVIENNLDPKEAMIAYQYNLLDKKIIKKAVKCNMDMKVSLNEAIKIINYLSNQKQKCTEYKDYLEFADKIGMNIEDKRVRFPADLENAHDEVVAQYEVVGNEENEKKIHEYASELNYYSFEDKKLMIRPAESIKELVLESKKLNHCVRNYSERMANRKTAIFFIRNKSNPTDPFYTLELNQGKVIQVRGKKNCQPTDNVNAFVKGWEKRFQLSGW